MMTRDEVEKLLNETINQFQERLFRYSENNEQAKAGAVNDTIEGLDAMAELEDGNDFSSASITFRPGYIEGIAYRLALAFGAVPVSMYLRPGAVHPLIKETVMDNHAAHLAIVKYSGFTPNEILSTVFDGHRMNKSFQSVIKVANRLALEYGSVPNGVDKMEAFRFGLPYEMCVQATRLYKGRALHEINLIQSNDQM